MENYYLKDTIKVEPLIWGWYAWPYLIPPITAACNIVERHLKIMQSYVQNPTVHAQAVTNPQLLGGPFVDLNGEKVDKIKSLIEKTKCDCKTLIMINNSLKEFDSFLKLEAKGDTLEQLYGNVPDLLKGLIELVYDLNSHPSIRLIEPLIYNAYYTTEHQSISLSETKHDDRKFVLSTPRLDDNADEVYLNIPFSDPILDFFFKMKKEPKNLDNIIESFKILPSKEKLFKSFFTLVEPLSNPDRNYYGDGVRIRYFGHACILIQTKAVSILFDPAISYPVVCDFLNFMQR